MVLRMSHKLRASTSLESTNHLFYELLLVDLECQNPKESNLSGNSDILSSKCSCQMVVPSSLGL